MAIRFEFSESGVVKFYMHGDIIHRFEGNPILTASMWPYSVHTVFNPGAVRLKDGRTLLLCRCEDHRGFSHLTKAISRNGIDGWAIDECPTLMPDPDNYHEELWGIEDPRITYLPDLDKYGVVYTAYAKGGPGVALALTEDFETFERCGLIMQPHDKDAALYPRQFKDGFALIHRPYSGGRGDMWISHSPDLYNWGGHKILLRARRGAWWDANKIGLSPPPIETSKGWLVLYHGVRTHASGSLYRVGLALFDIENPDHCLLRGEPWCMGPVSAYEQMGDVGSVVFPCGVTVDDDGDTVRIYYGAADSCIGMATTTITMMLQWLEEFGTTRTGMAGTAAEEAVLVE